MSEPIQCQITVAVLDCSWKSEISHLGCFLPSGWNQITTVSHNHHGSIVANLSTSNWHSSLAPSSSQSRRLRTRLVKHNVQRLDIPMKCFRHQAHHVQQALWCVKHCCSAASRREFLSERQFPARNLFQRLASQPGQNWNVCSSVTFFSWLGLNNATKIRYITSALQLSVLLSKSTSF